MRIKPVLAQRVAVGLMWVITFMSLGVLVYIVTYILARGLRTPPALPGA